MTELASPRPDDAPDLESLTAYLEAEGFEGPVEVQQFTEGASNLTFLVQVGDEEMVLRRPPRGQKAATAHDMAREVRVLEGVVDALPEAPRVLAFCDDPSVLGEPFYLMERRRGVILRRELPPGFQLSEDDAAALCDELVRVHAKLHAVDVEACGLGDLGRPEGYARRQIEGWSKRYRAARTDDVPDNEALMGWLVTELPPEEGRTALIHNDYKLDNVVLQRGDGRLRITGVLDWEMATLGDPLLDLGASLAYWVESGDPPPMQAIRRMPTHLPGMLSRKELVARYFEHSGLEERDLNWHYVYGLFRLAGIAQQIYRRYLDGDAADPRFAALGQAVQVLSGVAGHVAGGGRW